MLTPNGSATGSPSSWSRSLRLRTIELGRGRRRLPVRRLHAPADLRGARRFAAPGGVVGPRGLWMDDFREVTFLMILLDRARFDLRLFSLTLGDGIASCRDGFIGSKIYDNVGAVNMLLLRRSPGPIAIMAVLVGAKRSARSEGPQRWNRREPNHDPRVRGCYAVSLVRPGGDRRPARVQRQRRAGLADRAEHDEAAGRVDQ